MKEEIIKKKIEEVDELLNQEITVINYDFYDKLLIIRESLWRLLYFEINERENFLIK